MKIGTDIIDIQRFESLYNDKVFLQKVYSKKELKYIYDQSSIQRKLELLAGRFSAKEAFLKAMGIGIMGGIPLCKIEVLPTKNGKPLISLDNSILMTLKQKKIILLDTDLSISHTQDKAIAVVILLLSTISDKESIEIGGEPL